MLRPYSVFAEAIERGYADIAECQPIGEVRERSRSAELGEIRTSGRSRILIRGTAQEPAAVRTARTGWPFEKSFAMDVVESLLTEAKSLLPRLESRALLGRQ